MRIPTQLLRDTVTAYPRTQTGRGHANGPSVTLRCRIEQTLRTSISDSGVVTAVTVRLIVHPDDAAGIEEGWRVAIPSPLGTIAVERTITDVTPITGPTGSLSHVEVTLA